ncbi:hypothetical protein niasHT_030182 [Heterodera trifolii]|uniref:Uncharacterized protein n=1 Tax=Heterodera trifolii TaxID=157864 RepID=A0ABD2K2T2_9BILA
MFCRCPFAVLLLFGFGTVCADVRSDLSEEDEVMLLVPFNARPLAKRFIIDFEVESRPQQQFEGRTLTKRGMPLLFPIPLQQKKHHSIDTRRAPRRNWLHFGRK